MSAVAASKPDSGLCKDLSAYDDSSKEILYGQQVLKAYENPLWFLQQIEHARSLPRNGGAKGVLCPAVWNGRVCQIKGCYFAHSLAVFYSFGLSGQYFKSRGCHEDRCKYGSKCTRLHRGDLSYVNYSDRIFVSICGTNLPAKQINILSQKDEDAGVFRCYTKVDWNRVDVPIRPNDRPAEYVMPSGPLQSNKVKQCHLLPQ